MNDFVGVPLSLGDSVIFIAPRYRHLVVGKIVAFTPKNVRVSYINTWNFGPPSVPEPLNVLVIERPTDPVLA